MLKRFSLPCAPSQNFLYIVKRFASSTQQWSTQEDEILKNFVQQNGRKWSQLVNHCLPTRTVSQCKSRWESKLDPVYIRGPFTHEEKELVRKGIEKFGEGEWTLISRHFLPHRSPRHISFQLEALKHVSSNKKAWTKEEDDLLLKGFAEFGRQWTHISKKYLPGRTRTQLWARYSTILKMNSEWTDNELDLLLKRTITLGPDWEKVAEGIPGKTPDQCQSVWKSKLDPDVNREKWSEEEERLFWVFLYKYEGNFKEVLPKLSSGRDLKQLYKKFHSIVGTDHEFQILYGELIKQRKSENRPAWRARMAKLVCEWIDADLILRETSNKSLMYQKAGSWDNSEVERLQSAVATVMNKKNYIHRDDWVDIANKVSGRTVEQCKAKYSHIIAKEHASQNAWTEEEDQLLQTLIEKHGASNWDKIAEFIPTHNKAQCMRRWNTHVKYRSDNISYGPLTDKEISLLVEGVQMFDTDWNAVRMTYLPNRTTQQLAQWWYRQKKKKEYTDGTIERQYQQRQPWTEEEDNALKVAVAKYENERGIVSSWAKVAKLLKHRTPKQCQQRWIFSLHPAIKKGRWSPEEEMRLLELVQKFKSGVGELQNIWPEIAKELNNGRTEWSCRMKFYYMKKKGLNFM